MTLLIQSSQIMMIGFLLSDRENQEEQKEEEGQEKEKEEKQEE